MLNRPGRIEILNTQFENIMIRKFHAGPGQAWCIIGANQSGAQSFFRLVSGDGEKDTSEKLELPENTGVVSFKDQQEIYEAELKKDETDFMDKIDPGTRARDFIHDPGSRAELIEALGLTGSLDKGYRQLSTGQSRKLMLLSRMTPGLSCLVIQSPYDGLDLKTCREVDKALARLFQENILVMVFVNNIDDIPAWCTHMGVMGEHGLELTGRREEVEGSLEQVFAVLSPDFQARAEDLAEKKEGRNQPGSVNKPEELIRLNKGFAGYQGTEVFKDLNLIIREGDHTLVTGPNGCGKSTLLQVIIGDHPACYRNDLRIFGIQRGTGESIWDLKQHMGIVSPELHRNYHVPGSTLHCIISGLFDSIGLYQTYTAQEEEKARQWLDRLGMAQDAGLPFRNLEYARQRLVLIARALIKLPRLLVLDEPTQGLDQLNREAVLDFLEGIAREKLSTILYVSHRRDEFRDFFVQHLELGTKTK